MNEEPRRLWAGATLSGLGIVLTVVWLLNNQKTHAYVLHWWKKLAELEQTLGLHPHNADAVTQQKGGGFPPYSGLLQAIPVIFLVAWVCLLAWGLSLSCVCSGH